MAIHGLELSGQFRDLLAGMAGGGLVRGNAVGQNVLEVLLKSSILEQIFGDGIWKFIVAEKSGGINLELVEKRAA